MIVFSKWWSQEKSEETPPQQFNTLPIYCVL